MGLWVTQHFTIGDDQRNQVRIGLWAREVTVESGPLFEDGHDYIEIIPRTRAEAMSLGIAFRKAAQRMEDIGKELD
jgi:hypothetical protein